MADERPTIEIIAPDAFVFSILYGPPHVIFGFALLLLWIGFTWHAFMSFLVPWRLTNALFTPGASVEAALADHRRKIILLPAIGVTLGYAFGVGLPTIAISLALSFLIIAAVAFYLVWRAPRWGFVSTEQLFLGVKGRRLAWALMASVYAFYGVLLRPEFFPLDITLLLPVLLYGALAFLVYRTLRSSVGVPAATAPSTTLLNFPARFFLRYGAFFALFTLAFGGVAAVVPLSLQVVVAVIIITGAGLPFVLFARLILQMARGAQRDHRTPSKVEAPFVDTRDTVAGGELLGGPARGNPPPPLG